MTAPGFAPDWPLPPGVRAWQTERGGGVSRGSYASLNLGDHVGDAAERVAANRRLLIEALELPGTPAWLEQVHGARIVDLDAPWSGPADGAVAGRPGRICAVLTADCLPVLLAASSGRSIGAAHAGWRGLAAGVLPAAVRALDEDPAEVTAWLGPAIGPDAYEVGDEVRAALVARDQGHAAAFAANARGRWQADLAAIARRELEAAGVRQIRGGEFCTFTETQRFFSHRREAPCGRMATLIWIEDAGTGSRGGSAGPATSSPAGH